VRVDLGPVGALEEGAIGVVKVGPREIAYVRWGTTVFAFRNVCPHQSARLSPGVVCGRLVSDGVGRVALAEGNPVVRCPWHTWEFDLGSGRSVLLGDAFRFAVYPVEVEAGRAAVVLPDRGGAAG
jgi:3-phenylpropionate/trans-cinnamate dioxygenase ferredoxin subunit